MLASLLPGLRDLRNPLVLGWTWFAFLWIALAPVAPTRASATGLVADVLDAVDAAGPTMTAAALTFLAYLLGSLVSSEYLPLPWLLRQELSFEIVGDAGWTYRGNWARTRVTADLGNGRVYQAQANMGNDALQTVRDHVDSIAFRHSRDGSPVWALYIALTRVLQDRMASACASQLRASEEEKRGKSDQPTDVKPGVGASFLIAVQVLEQKTELETRLLAERKEVYDYYDRLVEAFTLRLNLAPPVFAITTVASGRLWADLGNTAPPNDFYTHLPPVLFSIGLLLIGALIFRALLHRRQAEAALVTALTAGIIESPLLARWESLCRELAEQ